MSQFQALLDQYTDLKQPQIHGVICKCVDRNGNEIYSKVAGRNSLGTEAVPLREDAVLKVASATKLITSIALLQYVDQGLITLDEPLGRIIPELNQKDIITPSNNIQGFEMHRNQVDITARQLLSHTSGLAYRFLHPLLIKWDKTPNGQQRTNVPIEQKYDVPLVFQPSTGWAYGVSLDFAGVVVRRLHGNISLEQYMMENIWKRLDLPAPYPTFHLSQHPEYEARLMKAAEREADGQLKSYEFWQGNSPSIDEEAGGHDLVCTAQDWLAVLADLISDNPKLLKKETIDLMFEPQLAAGSLGLKMLHQLRPAWEMLSGPIVSDEEAVNHGLGGILLIEDVPETGQPKGILTWGGASNIVWWVARDQGVAGLFATQFNPFGDRVVKELVNSWKKEFWQNNQ